MNQDNLKFFGRIVSPALLILLFLSGFKSYATDGIFKGAPLYGKNRQIAKDSIIYVADTILNNSSLRVGWTARKVRNIITFKIDEFANLAIPDSFQVTLKFRFTTIKWIYTTNQPATAVTTTADSTLLITYNKNQTYNGKAVLVLPDVFSSSVKIVSVSVTDTTTNLYKSLMVENEIQTGKEYTSFDCSNSAVQTINQSTATVITDGELKVFWSPVKGADEYDLEWSYIDSSALASYYFAGTSTFNPFKIFDNNASRASISNENYNIPLLYDNTGTLFFRVRSVQIKNNGQRTGANWSSAYTGGLGLYVFGGHERKLNWQAKTSFAEEGKRKSVIQYFDGSLRNRQTVTKDNTTDTTIVAETFYDNQGRPIIQVLPSPSLNRIIKYNPGFNASINSTEYDKTYYDAIMTNGADYCAKGADKLGTQSGAAKYYSPQNQNVNNGFNKFIPDAKGYPFTETKYTQDNTGRISAQSGVGPHHQLGQTDMLDGTTVNHETKYYYGTADQEDLDALFGTEAGNYTHYFKNMVRDANGQYSVSYIDMHSRTIATALAGTPANTSLDILPSNLSRTTTKKLLDSNNNIIKGNAIESIKNLVVTKKGNHYFNYSLAPESLQLKGCDSANICYDCLYDLTITVTDNCNNQNLPGGVPHVITKKNFTIPQPDTSCTNAALFNVLDTLFNLPEGVYAISKKLEISKYGTDYYRDSIFLKHNTCKSLVQFISEQKQIILSNLNCGLTCQQCTDSLGTPESFRIKFMQKLGISPADSASYRGQALQSYNAQKEDCDLLCGKQSLVDDIRTHMLADMTAPSGQYANDADSIESKRDYYSIYNRIGGLSGNKLRYQTPLDPPSYQNPDGSNSTVLNPNQQPQSPESLSIDQFNDNFTSSWATSLLPYHPEYYKYQKLSKLKPSLSWDEKFLKVETFREAYTSGYLNPTANATAPFSKYPIVTANIDPFYQNEVDSFQTNTFKTSAEAYMRNVSADLVNTLSIWAAATSMAKCENGNNTCLNNYRNGAYAFDSTGAYALCKGELDMAWRYFREMYINKKRSITNNLINATPIYPLPGNGHVLHFTDLNSLIVTGGALDTSLVAGTNSLTAFINDNCTASAVQWWHELAPCKYTSADSAIIIPRLIAVCIAGGDSAHPYGSRTIKPGSNNTYKSFEEVIKNYNQNHIPVIPYNSSCNAELMVAPLPYNQQQAISNMEIWAKPDSCTCSGINSLYNQYVIPGNTDTSFAAYVNRVNGTQMSEADLQTLRGMCNNTSSCTKLENPIILPPAIQCGVTNSCATCLQVKNVTDSFNVTFPNTVITYDENDSLQRVKNHLFETYVNLRLGFSKTAQEYLTFMDTCAKFSTAICDTFQSIIKSFVQTVKPGRVVTGLETEGGQTYNDLHQIIDTGTIHFPNSVRQIPSGWYNNYGVTMSNFCTSNGYIAEVKFKFLADSSKTGDIFYSSLAPAGLTGDRESNGVYARDSLNRYYLLDPNPKAQLNWMILKAKVTPAFTSFYYNNNFIYKWPNYSLGNISSFGLGLFYRQGCIDYIKISDTLGNVKYFEDYNDADYPATVDPSFICPAPPNCQTSFAGYYNSRKGTNYTFSQIDSIYLLNCGKHLDVCSNNNVSKDTTLISSTANAPHLCGKAEPAFPVMRPTQWGPCDDSTNFALIKGTQLYEAYRDSLNDIFNAAYNQKCLNAQKLESFTVTAPVSEYHYTLYYYGQAGNLIKTVPPQGVDLSKFTTSGWSATVATARKNNQRVAPSHTLFTIYRYNTLSQVVAQQTPDAGKSEFWYDRLGRLAISQNAKQKNYFTENGRSYSYTLYDGIGRITEVGEYVNPSTTPMTDALSRSQGQLNSWLGTQSKRSQITSTVYDLEYPGWVTPNKQLYPRNLRNRVAYTKYTIGSNSLAYNQASFYSYDIHGNVDTLVQDYGRSDTPTTANMMNLNNNRWKKIVYKYDLISGKVNHVAYQPQYISPADNKLYVPGDAMYHKYEYDAENRLTAVYTSIDSVIWEKDARYEYYKHGPLARTTLGGQLVQGMDYAYTLQGWLKGVNSTSLLPANDMGRDGNGTTGQNQNQYVAKDAIGFNLNYYTGDHAPINIAFTPFPISNTFLNSAYKPLYNGNISSMAVNINNLTIPGGTVNGGGAMLYNYKYDQLNRITEMDAYTGLANNSWNGSITLKNEYKERVSYDANGNILKYLRNGNKTATIVMDSLGYKYYANTNQLSYVTDNVAATAYASPDADIDNQRNKNYQYDLIGNLVNDSAENINYIEWNVYGKITIIRYSNTAVNTMNAIYYFYDASGSRIGKLAQTNVAGGTTSALYTWYVKDASGNVMATYSSTASGYSYPSNLAVSERHLYGSSRLGIFALSKDVKTTPSFTQTTPYKLTFTRGYKYYELSNHLGNVLATISDKKTGHDAGNGTIDYYDANVVSANDYYPFGMGMPGRKYSVANTNYRYGFNGKENDNEVKGQGNQQNYGMRIYDPRLGKFLSVDPLTKKFPYYTPYQFAGDMPITAIDLDGGEPKVSNNPELKGKEERMWAVDAAYNKTGGDEKYLKSPITETLGTYEKKVDKTKFFANSDGQMNRTVNESNQFIVTKESSFKTEQDLVNHLLGNFVWGVGPENYVFPENGKFSSLLKGSIAVGESLANWSKSGHKDGVYYWGMNLRGEVNVDANSGFTSLEHFLGSVAVKISKVDAQNIRLEIFNVTSLTSGDINKDAPIVKWFNNPLKSTVRDGTTHQQTDHSNISQHFSLTISKSEADKLINQYAPKGN